MYRLTFWNSKKPHQYNTIAVRTPNAIENVSDREIERMVLSVPCGNRDCSLVTPNDEGHKG